MFEDLLYAQPQNLYVKKPVQDFVNAASIVNDRYDKNLANANAFDMAMANIPAREELKGQLTQELSRYDNALKEYSTKGDYENSGNAINKLAVDFAKNPLVRGISEDYRNYNNWVSTYQKEVNDGKVSRDDFEKSLILAKTKFNKPLELDNLTGSVNGIFNGNTIPQDINFEDKISDLVGKLEKGYIPPDANDRVQNFSGYYTSIIKEGKDPEKLAQLARQYILNSPEAKTLLGYRADLDTKIGRLQEDGSLRPYNRADLERLGLPSDEIDKLFTNGVLNQEVADNVAKSLHFGRTVNNLENFARSFGNNTLKVDYHKNWIQGENIAQANKERDKAIEHQYKLEEQVNKNNYYDPAKILIGEKSSIDPSQSKAYGLDNYGLSGLTMPEEFTRTSKDGLSLSDKATLRNFRDAYQDATSDRDPEAWMKQRLNKVRQIEGKNNNDLTLRERKIKENLIRYGNEIRQNPRLAKLTDEQIAKFNFKELDNNEVTKASRIANGLLKLRDNGATVKSQLQEGANVKRDASGNLLANLELKPNEGILKTLSEEEKTELKAAGLLVTNPNFKHKTKVEGKGDDREIVETDNEEFILKVPVNFNLTPSGNQRHAIENKYIDDFTNESSNIREINYTKFKELTKKATPERLQKMQLGEIQTMTNIQKVMKEGTYNTIETATNYINNLYLDAKKGDRDSYIALINIID